MLTNKIEDNGALYLADLPENASRNDAHALIGEAMRLEAQAAASLRLMGRLLWQEGDALGINMTVATPASREEMAAFCDLMGRVVGACEDAHQQAVCALEELSEREAPDHEED